jgi:hypothetical protein
MMLWVCICRRPCFFLFFTGILSETTLHGFISLLAGKRFARIKGVLIEKKKKNSNVMECTWFLIRFSFAMSITLPCPKKMGIQEWVVIHEPGPPLDLFSLTLSKYGFVLMLIGRNGIVKPNNQVFESCVQTKKKLQNQQLCE